jgi:hypothetical protein
MLGGCRPRISICARRGEGTRKRAVHCWDHGGHPSGAEARKRLGPWLRLVGYLHAVLRRRLIDQAAGCQRSSSVHGMNSTWSITARRAEIAVMFDDGVPQLTEPAYERAQAEVVATLGPAAALYRLATMDGRRYRATGAVTVAGFAHGPAGAFGCFARAG